MYIADCQYQLSGACLLFHATGHSVSDPCELRVTFKPVAYYPPERDVGAGADFQANITAIEIRDLEDPDETGWHKLEGADFETAFGFLDTHHNSPMWDQAEIETAEHFGVDSWLCAA